MHVLKQVTTIEIFWPVTLKHVHWYNPNMGTPNKQIDTWKFIKHYAQRNNDRQWSTQWDHHCRTPHNTESVAIAEIVKLQRPPKKNATSTGKLDQIEMSMLPRPLTNLTIWPSDYIPIGWDSVCLHPCDFWAGYEVYLGIIRCVVQYVVGNFECTYTYIYICMYIHYMHNISIYIYTYIYT